MNERFKRWFVLFLKVGISFLLLFWLYTAVDLGELQRQIANTSVILLSLAFVVLFLSHLLGVAQWRSFLKGARIPLPFWKAVYYYYTGLFFNNFFFSSVGGDAVRVFEVSKREKKDAGRVLACILVDRIFGLLVLLVFGNMALIIYLMQGYPAFNPLVLGYLLIDGAALFGVLAFLSKRVRYFLYWVAKRLPGRRFRLGLFHFLQVVSGYRAGWKVFVRAFPWGFANQLVKQLSVLLVAIALDRGQLSVNPLFLFVFVPLLGVIRVLPLSIMGLGPMELAGRHLFRLVGILPVWSLPFLFLNQFLVIGANLLSGLAFLFGRRRKND